MNLILFDSAATAVTLPRTDPRARHLLDVLRRSVGDTFDAGVLNGPRGKGTLGAVAEREVELSFAWGPPPAPPDPIVLIVGLPRPQTARDILRDATTLGLAAIHFVQTEKSDPSYAQSTLWTGGEWARHLRDGAQQAFDTRTPVVTHGHSLGSTLAALAAGSARLALDNYEAHAALGQVSLPSAASVVLAIGSERGWGPTDRAELRAHSFQLVHLGSRVLRTETATIAALTLVRAKLGLV